MPLKTCSEKGDAGYKWGTSGACYTYPAGDEKARKAAKQKAVLQGVAVEGGSKSLPANPAKVYEAEPEAVDRVLAELGRAGLFGDPDVIDVVRSFGVTKTCAACGSRLAISKFPDDHRTRDGHGSTCVDCRFDAADDDGTGTIDLLGIDVLAAGGPYFGKGSPPEGDYFDDAYLQRLADDTNAAIAAGEHDAPVRIEPGGRSRLKLGHGDEQNLLREAGLFLDDGETPAAGWQENFRVEEGKLLADWRHVPKKVASLLKRKAFRKKSVEIRTLASQTEPDKKYRVVVATALLGAKAPAVRTLDEILALASAAHAPAVELLLSDETDEGVEATVDYGSGDVVWEPDAGLNSLRDALSAALNGPPGSSPMGYRFWVMDVAPNGSGYRGLVQENGAESNSAWVVPFTLDAAGDASPSPSSDWTPAEQAWVDAGPSMANENGQRGDTSPRMPETPAKPVLSDEQIVALASTFGVTEDDEAKRREAVEAKLKEFAGETPPPEPPTPPTPTEPPPSGEGGRTALEQAELESWKAKAERGDQAFEEMRQNRISAKLDAAQREGRLDPAKRPVLVQAFEENEELAEKILAEFPVNEEFRRVYGADGDGLSPDDQASSEDRAYEAWVALSGGPAPSLQKASA